jgi:hypothetical protein
MHDQSKKYQTQWAAQFFVAAELTRRGNLVALTLGNAKEVDLLVISQGGIKYGIDVKGLSSKNFWLIKYREPKPDLYYILTYIPAKFKPPEYYILSSSDLMTEIALLKSAILTKGGSWSDQTEGVNWSQVLKYRDRWDALPT